MAPEHFDALTKAVATGVSRRRALTRLGAGGLTAGDWLFVEDPRDAVRNAGGDDVVLLVAGLTRVGEPFTRIMTEAEKAGMETAATPAP